MPKRTLLDLTQTIASSIDSDEINSITDTVEALQIATIIRDAYYDIILTVQPPELKNVIQLESVSQINHPNALDIPEDVEEIFWIKYNFAAFSDDFDYREVRYYSPEDFLTYISRRNGQTDGFQEVSIGGGVRLQILNNQGPRFWTTFDDHRIYFDSFDVNIETTMQERNSMAYARMDPPFTMSDEFIPDLDANLFPYLLAESESRAFINLKQMPNQKAEQRARTNRMHVSHNVWRANQRKPYNTGPDYGRRGPR